MDWLNALGYQYTGGRTVGGRQLDERIFLQRFFLFKPTHSATRVHSPTPHSFSPSFFPFLFFSIMLYYYWLKIFLPQLFFNYISLLSHIHYSPQCFHLHLFFDRNHLRYMIYIVSFIHIYLIWAWLYGT